MTFNPLDQTPVIPDGRTNIEVVLLLDNGEYGFGMYDPENGFKLCSYLVGASNHFTHWINLTAVAWCYLREV
jgi:hypothetical protein